MLLPPTRDFLLELLQEFLALHLHGRNFDGCYLVVQLRQDGCISSVCFRVIERLLIGTILLLVVANVSAVLLHQGNPLLEGLELHISLVFQGRINCWRRENFRGTGGSTASICATCA